MNLFLLTVFLFMTILAQTFLTFMRGHLGSFALFTTWHKSTLL